MKEQQDNERLLVENNKRDEELTSLLQEELVLLKSQSETLVEAIRDWLVPSSEDSVDSAVVLEVRAGNTLTADVLLYLIFFAERNWWP